MAGLPSRFSPPAPAREGRGKASSIAPQQPGEPALDGDLLGAVALRIEAAGRRTAGDRRAFAAIGLQRRFLVIDESDHDLAVASGVLAADQRIIAVQYALIDHRIAGH